MPYQLSTEKKGHYLHLRVTGEVSPETVAAYMEEGIAKCVEMGCPNVLVEENLRGPTLDIESLHRVIAGAATRGRSALNLVAYVNTSPDHDPELMRFAENVAVNRAMNVRVFRAVAEAENWLLYHARQNTPAAPSPSDVPRSD